MSDRPPSDHQRSLDRRLIEAIAADDYDGAFALILSGADARHDNEAPLRAAAREGRTAIVRLLLEGGADYSVHDHKPLRAAEENGHFETAGVLRGAGSYNPSVRGDFERTMAERAARRDCPESEKARSDGVRDFTLRMFSTLKPTGPPKP